jgi:hypothetical protein
MKDRHFLFAALVIAPMAFAGCGNDATTQVESVRLAVQATRIPGSDHGGRGFTTALTQEVTQTPVWSGDADGTGEALLTINAGKGEVCWVITVSNISLPATASHIHEAAPGVRGPIVVSLSAPDADGKATGCTSSVSRDLLQRILQTPGAFYANVHTSDYPAGAVRGQLP